MADPEQLGDIIQVIERLMNGQNPSTGEPFEDDLVLDTPDFEVWAKMIVDILAKEEKRFHSHDLSGTRNEVEQKRVYRHFKGKLYYVHDVVTDSETREEMVSYQPLYPPYAMFVRSKSMFLEDIDPEREGNVTGQNQRFQRYDPC